MWIEIDTFDYVIKLSFAEFRPVAKFWKLAEAKGRVKINYPNVMQAGE